MLTMANNQSMSVLWYLFIILFCAWESVECSNGSCMRIGAIANGTPGKNTTIINMNAHSVAVEWNFVDTSEVYHIFRSIQVLDHRPDIDLITLFDYDASILKIPHLLNTAEKKVIKWGERRRDARMRREISNQTDPVDLCGDQYVPELSFDDPYCQTDFNVSLDTTNMSMRHELLTQAVPRAMASLVKELTWNSIIILHENATELETSELVDALSNDGVMFSIFNVDIVDDLHAVLYLAYEASVPLHQQLNVVVLCRFFCVRKILYTAYTFDIENHILISHKKTLMKTFSRWLIALHGHSKGMSRALQQCANDLDNVAIVAIPEFNGATPDDLTFALEDVMENLEPSDDVEYAKDFIKYSLAIKAATWSSLYKCLGYKIDTLLWAHSGRSFSSVGYMNDTGAVSVLSDIFPNIKYGYNKRNFLVGLLPYEPFIFKRFVNGTAVYEGFCIDLLEELAKALNFTYTLLEPEDGNWGSLINQDTLLHNGLVGQLQRSEVNMTCAPLTTTSVREQVIDFSYPFFYEYSTVLTKKVDPNLTKWRTLLDPFRWQVLLSIGIALLIITTLVFLLEKYNTFYDTPEHYQNRENNGGLHTWADSLWYMYGALLCQGGVHLPDSTTGRTLVSFWWIFCIIVVGTYCGNLIAFLTVTKEKLPFNNLVELAKTKGSYKWGTQGGTAWEVIFLTSDTRTFQAIGDGIREFNKTDPDVLNADPQVHIEKVLQGGYAYISESLSLTFTSTADETFAENAMYLECRLVRLSEDFFPIKYGIGFPNNSPHTQIFTEQIMKIQESGLLQLWKKKWWPKANFCTSRSYTEAKPISLTDVQSAFYICIIGIFIGSVAFFVEILIKKIRTSKEREVQRQ